MPSNAEYMLTEIWEACKHTAPGSPTLGLCLPSERPTSGLASEGKSLEGTQSEQSRAPAMAHIFLPLPSTEKGTSFTDPGIRPGEFEGPLTCSQTPS